MTVDYSKAEAEARYFLLFGAEGAWQEVSEDSYVAAEQSQGFGSKPTSDFSSEKMRGVVTRDGSRPKDIKAEKVVEPMVRRTSDKDDSSIRLIFPEGSYSVASVGQDSGPDFGMVTIILTPEQYDRLAKAQSPIGIDRFATRLEEKGAKSGGLKDVVLGGVALGLHQIAADMRDGTPTPRKRPSIQDLKDLLKG